MVPQEGIEPPTHALRMRCSTPELLRHLSFIFNKLHIRYHRHAGLVAHAPVKTTHASAAAGQSIEACNRPAAVARSLTAIRVVFKSRWHTGAQQKASKFTFGVAPQRRPVLHELMADGRITEFKSATVVVPESPREKADTQVLGCR